VNGGLHAVSVGKPSEWMSNFWTVRFLKTESEPNFGFPHIPSNKVMPLNSIGGSTMQRVCGARFTMHASTCPTSFYRADYA